jgi:hypothetical protein
MPELGEQPPAEHIAEPHISVIATPAPVADASVETGTPQRAELVGIAAVLSLAPSPIGR